MKQEERPLRAVAGRLKGSTIKKVVPPDPAKLHASRVGLARYIVVIRAIESGKDTFADLAAHTGIEVNALRRITMRLRQVGFLRGEYGPGNHSMRFRLDADRLAAVAGLMKKPEQLAPYQIQPLDSYTVVPSGDGDGAA